MSDTKILQAILDKVNQIDKKVDEVKREVKDTKTGLTKRIDTLGIQIANLEDDAPTMEKFQDLEKRVKKLEKQQLN